VPGRISEEDRRELQNVRKEYQKQGPEVSGWIGKSGHEPQMGLDTKTY
jgi:hypothetical protein